MPLTVIVVAGLLVESRHLGGSELLFIFVANFIDLSNLLVNDGAIPRTQQRVSVEKDTWKRTMWKAMVFNKASKVGVGVGMPPCFAGSNK